MADPHRPLYLDDPEPYPYADLRRLWDADWTIIHSQGHWIARKRRRLYLSDRLRLDLLERLWRASNGLCAYCSRPTRVIPLVKRNSAQPFDMATIDHRVSLANGGTWKRNNLVCACRSCNDIKGILSEEVYVALVAETPPVPGGFNVGVRKRKAAQIAVEMLKLKRGGGGSPSPGRSASVMLG